MHPSLRYIQGYPKHILDPVTQLVESGKLVPWFEARYPKNHEIKAKALFDYAIEIKIAT